MSCLAVKTLLLLKSIPGFGCKTINQIISKKNNITDILNYSQQQLLELGFSEQQAKYVLKPHWQYAENQINIAKINNIEIISIFDNHYPRNLKHIYDPPVLLYVKGDKRILNAHLFAIVGTRKPTIYGRQMAELFSNEIQAHGYILTSGFAVGIDIIAHLAALKKNHPTVVVLGTSLDCIYPDVHKKYVDKIIECGGVVISENGFTTRPSPSCFPSRNRIISGLSQGVLIVEAARKSGSLITARCAMEQSREVFAIPGNINNTQALGCLDLIANGAKLVIDTKDIVEELIGFKMSYTQNQVKKITSESRAEDYYNLDITDTFANPPVSQVASYVNPNQVTFSHINSSTNLAQQLLLSAISGGAADFDEIVHNCNLSASQVATQLIQLEIMGLVACAGGRYVKL